MKADLITNETETPIRTQILLYIEQYYTENGFGPAYHEIETALNVSKSTAYYHVAKLSQEGLVRRTTGKARSLVPIPRE